MDNAELIKLLAATAQQDRGAFRELYNRTSGQLYAVAKKMLVDADLAQDALQDAYIKIWHNASEYQSAKGQVLTWMISIVRYRALDMIRYYNVRKEDELKDYDAATEVVDDIPFEGEADRIQICMNELDQHQRQAIQLAYFQGLSHQEVVNYLHSPLGTIKSWIRRGLQSLQRCLTT